MKQMFSSLVYVGDIFSRLTGGWTKEEPVVLELTVLGNFLCLCCSAFEVKRFPFWYVSLDVPQTEVTNFAQFLAKTSSTMSYMFNCHFT